MAARLSNHRKLTYSRMVFGRAYDDRYIIPSGWYAVWQISTNTGSMAGAILCGWLQDRIGRRWSLFASSMVISVAVAICYVSDLPTGLASKRGLSFVAKTVQGFGVGGMVSGYDGGPRSPIRKVDVYPDNVRRELSAQSLADDFPIDVQYTDLAGTIYSSLQ